MSRGPLPILFPESIEGPVPCPYLPTRAAHFSQGRPYQLTAEGYQQLLDRGYRKFGKAVFRTVCEGCQECTPIRVPVEKFAPSSSQKRIKSRNSDLQLIVGAAEADDRRLTLFKEYHFSKFLKKGWPFFSLSEEQYLEEFLVNPLGTLEMSLWQDENCLGVLLAEETPVCLSAIYHYYDIREARRSLGTFLIMTAIEEAARRGKQYCYLGFYIKDSLSMKYKAYFRPYELLRGGLWRPG